MATFKNTLDILTNPWNDDFSQRNISARTVPTTSSWSTNNSICIDDIILWEQLYYEPGNIGIYVAFNPYAEFYLITYNLFFDTEFKFEEFSGDNAAQECYDRAAELGLRLEYTQVLNLRENKSNFDLSVKAILEGMLFSKIKSAENSSNHTF